MPVVAGVSEKQELLENIVGVAPVVGKIWDLFFKYDDKKSSRGILTFIPDNTIHIVGMNGYLSDGKWYIEDNTIFIDINLHDNHDYRAEYKGSINDDFILGTMTAYKKIEGEYIEKGTGTWVASIEGTIKTFKTTPQTRANPYKLLNIENTASKE